MLRLQQGLDGSCQMHIWEEKSSQDTARNYSPSVLYLHSEKKLIVI